VLSIVRERENAMFTTKNLSWFVIILLTVVFCSLMTETAFAIATDETDGAVLYVKVGGNGDCSTWEQACELQTALTTASSGDQIWVGAGTYKPTTTTDRNISFVLKSGVAIYGGFPANGGDWRSRAWETNTTTLSGDIGVQGNSSDNSYHVVFAGSLEGGVDTSSILDGFTITGGNSDSSGGGILLSESSPTLRNLKFTDNIALNYGGAMHNTMDSSPTLANVIFVNNSSAEMGGAIYNSYSGDPTIINGIFENNMSKIGGGICDWVGSRSTLKNVVFNNNTATNVGGGLYISNATIENAEFHENSALSGGGIFNAGNSNLMNVDFYRNSANYGGGIYNDYANHPTLSNVIFRENTADFGGGMYNYDRSNPIIENSTFSSNIAMRAGGIFNSSYSNPLLINVTLSFNISYLYGDSMINSNNSNPTIINSIFWGSGSDQIYNEGNSNPTITFSDIKGGFEGEGNIDLDPLLGPLQDNGGFTFTHALLPGSPAIDAGSPDNCPYHDQRGYPRPIDGNGDSVALCDMGAYEYGEFLLPHVFLPLIQR